MNRIRIELTSPTASDGKVFYLHPDGTETEISNAITGIELHAKVGDITTATLHTILVEGHALAEVEDVIVNHLKPKRRGWPREVTSFASRIRKWVTA